MSEPPVAWKYDWRMKMFASDEDDGWVTTVGFKQPKEDHHNGYRNVTPLYAEALDTALTRIRELEQALKEISSQKLTVELIAEFGVNYDGDFEYAYDAIIRIARAALSSKDQEKTLLPFHDETMDDLNALTIRKEK